MNLIPEAIFSDEELDELQKIVTRGVSINKPLTYDDAKLEVESDREGIIAFAKSMLELSKKSFNKLMSSPDISKEAKELAKKQMDDVEAKYNDTVKSAAEHVVETRKRRYDIMISLVNKLALYRNSKIQ